MRQFKKDEDFEAYCEQYLFALLEGMNSLDADQHATEWVNQNISNEEREQNEN
jgi:hypothetical protein